MNTIEPYLRSSIPGRNAFVNKNVDRIFVFIIQS